MKHHERPPLVIPSGKYTVGYVGYQTRQIFNSAKLYAFFKVLDFGPFFETVLVRHYNCKLKGKPGKNGKFEAGWRSKLMQEYVGIIGKRPDRKDRVSMSRLCNLMAIATVETITRASDQSVIPEDLRYSAIKKLEPYTEPMPLPIPVPT